MNLSFDLQSAAERASTILLIQAVDAGVLSGVMGHVPPVPVNPSVVPPQAAPPAMPAAPPAMPAAPPAMPAMPAAMPGMPAVPAAVTPPAAVPPAAMPPVDPAIPGACPITTGPEFIKYIMDSYQELGAAKGGQINSIFEEFGCDHLNKITPEMYPAVWAKIENLKAAPQG